MRQKRMTGNGKGGSGHESERTAHQRTTDWLDDPVPCLDLDMQEVQAQRGATSHAEVIHQEGNLRFPQVFGDGEGLNGVDNDHTALIMLPFSVILAPSLTRPFVVRPDRSLTTDSDVIFPVKVGNGVNRA